ncbi:substrate-binding periplasmic protein [Chitinimonas sp. BJB300]|uniref:substrate-binding periplasmic protein n=1 Tax=Chitinimonas sp. BJB300 TaxID=1559339 RepID=UPI001304305E|nr:transporter substrate-binding domain-containing protein [Chitinimonas sp. BJB300]
MHLFKASKTQKVLQTLSVTCALVIGVTTQAAPLRLCYEDVDQPPWTYGDGHGLAMDLLRKVANSLGEEFVFSGKPWKRCIEEVRAGIVDGVVGAADVPERHDFVEYPRDTNGKVDTNAMLWHDHFYLFATTESKVEWDGVRFLNLTGSIATQRGYSVVYWLKQQGVPYAAESKDADELLRLLTSNLASAVIIQGPVAVKMATNDSRFKGKVRTLAKPYRSEALYLIVNKQSYAKASDRINAIWQAITKHRQSAEYQASEAKALNKFMNSPD